jgi:hypothetical protein
LLTPGAYNSHEELFKLPEQEKNCDHRSQDLLGTAQVQFIYVILSWPYNQIAKGWVDGLRVRKMDPVSFVSFTSSSFFFLI